MIAGVVLAAALLLDLPWGLAGFLGAALAPTDAALSVQVINDERIPMRLRRALNVESGLNDGIATPIVTVMLAIAASQLGIVEREPPPTKLASRCATLWWEPASASAIGVGGAATDHLRDADADGLRPRAAGWPRSRWLQRLTVALAIDGNGFIAAFVAGIAFGATLADEVSELDRADELPELGGELLALVVWFLFGAALLPAAFSLLDVLDRAYALLSLTVVRMVPVLLSTIARARPTDDLSSPGSVLGACLGRVRALAFEMLGENRPRPTRPWPRVTFTVC